MLEQAALLYLSALAIANVVVTTRALLAYRKIGKVTMVELSEEMGVFKTVYEQIMNDQKKTARNMLALTVLMTVGFVASVLVLLAGV